MEANDPSPTTGSSTGAPTGPTASQPSPDSRSPNENLRRILGSPTYMRAYEDVALLHRKELRPVRLQLELMKAELNQREEGINETVVFYGSARIQPQDDAEARLAAARRHAALNPGDQTAAQQVGVAENQLELSRYYEGARELSRLISTAPLPTNGQRLTVVTGGGPGIMEAGNRGAWEVGAKSIGMNITLPHEQAPNPYITPELCFQFHYFAIRKMHLFLRARAAVYFPGGFGTLDELFEALTLVQTRKVEALPIVLFGTKWWKSLVNWDQMVSAGTISKSDLDLVHFSDDAEETWSWLKSQLGVEATA